MGMQILDFILCAIEIISVYTFFNYTLERRFCSLIFLIVTAFINIGIIYFCSDCVIWLKSLICTTLFILGSSINFKGKTVIKTTYSVILLYTLYILDIIFGNMFSLIFNENFLAVFYETFSYRLVVCLFIKAIDIIVFILIYRGVSKIGSNPNIKMWVLFDSTMLVFLLVTVVFMSIYPNITQNTGSKILYLAISVSFFAMSMIVIYFFTEICAGFEKESKMFILKSTYNSIEENIAIQRQNAESLKKVRHDINNHLINVRVLIKKGDIDNAVSLLDKVAEQTKDITVSENISTGNSVVDAVVTAKSAVCKSKGISFNCEIEPLKDIHIDIADISSLLSNMLDNAIEASEQTDKPCVAFKMFKYNAYHAIIVENSCVGSVMSGKSDFDFNTTKPNKALHGYGTQIIKEIAQKYQGEVTWNSDNNIVKVAVFLKI